MKKAAYRILIALMWLFALGCAYIGIIFLILGPMMGPRGDIDYSGFTEGQKHTANVQALLMSLFGLIPLSLAGVLVYYSKRIARFILGITLGE